MELNLKNDIIFKAFFAKQGNEKYLKSFLEALLKKKIQEIEVMRRSKFTSNEKEDKLGRIDIKATINKNEIINIEMQLKNQHDMEKRSEFYGAKLVTNQLEKGKKYIKLKPVILINILNYNLLEVPEYCTKTVTVAEKHREYEVVKDITYYFIELPKFRKSKPRLANMLEVWLALIDGEGGLIEMGKYKYKIIEEVEKELEEIYADKELKALLDYRQSADLDRNSALYNAEQKGIKKRNKRINHRNCKKIETKEIINNRNSRNNRINKRRSRKIIIYLLF